MSRRKTPSRGLVWVAPLFLLALTLVYHAPALFEGRVIPTLDASRFFYPIWAWGARAWARGEIPLWNPDAGCGSVFAFDPQTASFYPPLRLAYGLWPAVSAFHGLIALHQVWALLGFWVYARRRGWNDWAAVSGALAFGFSASLCSAGWTPVALFAASWIPWVFAAGEALKEGKRWAGPAFFASVALQIASGYPVLPYLTGCLVWTHLAWGTPNVASRGGWVWRLAGCQALAVAANLLWLAPFLEIMRLGSLSPDGQPHYISPGWDVFKTLIDPFALGHPLAEGYRGPPFWVGSLYIGWPALGLVLGGLWMSLWKKWIRPAEYLTVALALWLSMGETALLGGVLRQIVPRWKHVLRSGFLLPLVAFLLGLLSARVLDEGWKRWKTRVVSREWASALVVLLALGPLLPAAWSLGWTLPRSYYLDRPASWVVPPPGSRLFHAPPLLEGALRLDGSNREEAYQSAKARLIPNWPLLFGWSETSDYNSFGLRELRDWKRGVFRVSPGHSRRALDYLGAGIIIGGSDLPGLRSVGLAAPGTPVYRNPDVLPLWFTVSEGLWAPNKEAAWSYMELKGLDFRRIAFLDRTEGVGAFGIREVREAPRNLNRVDLRLVGWTGRPALLVSSEAAAPGWKVWANGEPRRPSLLNHAFRGVILRDGDSEIHWSYEPAAFRLGLFLSLISWAVGLGWAMGISRNRQRMTVGG